MDKKDGASAWSISEKIMIYNLKDLVHKNSLDQYEILFDTESLLMIGSDNSVNMVPNLYTTYKVTLNKYKLYEDSVNLCLERYDCS